MRNFISSPPGLISLIGVLVLVVWRVVAFLSPALPPPLAPATAPVVIAMRMVITAVVLVSALYVVLSKRYETDTEKWAFGIIGLLIGYWMPAAC